MLSDIIKFDLFQKSKSTLFPYERMGLANERMGLANERIFRFLPIYWHSK